MKVLKTCLSKSWGGLEMYTLQTVEQLLKNGIDAELLCYPGSKIFDEAKRKGVKVHSSEFAGYFHPLEIKRTANFIKQNNYDIIHSGASKDLWLIVPALKMSSLKTPLLLSKHMGSYIVKKDFMHKWIYNRVNYALAISNVIAKNLVDTTPLPKEKALLLHNGIDTNVFDPAKIDFSKVRNEFGIGKEELLIGMMARFSPGKGHEEFLYAAGKMNEKHNNLRFMIVGEPSKGEDEYFKSIKNLAREKDPHNKIIFTGFRKDTPEVLAAMDIFVFPSHAEAFGIALVEAMSIGKPTICSNSDGVLDIAVDGITSYLFEKQNKESLSQKLDLLIQSPDLRKSFGDAGRNRAVQMFDIEVFTKKLIDIYRRALV
jgi:glycosyltransferase involved in cell wall biosynthesis